MWHSHFTGTVLDILTPGTNSSQTLEFKDFQGLFKSFYYNNILKDIPVHC